MKRDLMSAGKVTCLWIHGWGASPYIWEQSRMQFYLPPQQYDHRTVSFADVETIAQLKQRVREAVLLLPPGSAVIGWSMGAMLALECLAEHVQYASNRSLPRLVMIAGSLQFCCRDRRFGWPPRIVNRMQSQLDVDPQTVLHQFTQQMWSETEPQSAGEAWGCGFSVGGLQAGLDYLQEADLHEAWSQLAADHIQILWLHGEADNICPAAALPSATDSAVIQLLPGLGHAPFVSKPAEVFHQIKQFIETGSPS